MNDKICDQNPVKNLEKVKNVLSVKGFHKPIYHSNRIKYMQIGTNSKINRMRSIFGLTCWPISHCRLTVDQ